MSRPALEVADIFRSHGPAWRQARRGRISLDQLKVMTAIERCRSHELGAHQLYCPQCDSHQIAYNSCRNRHCPKCQSSAAQRWLEARQNELLPLEYYHVVFTLPAPIRPLAYHNQALVYRLLCQSVAETLLSIARDPRHLGARIGLTMVLHTWGSALSYHPHVHCIVPGGGIALDGRTWQACRAGFFLPVRVLSARFRQLFLGQLRRAYEAGQLQFFAQTDTLRDPQAFQAWLASLRQVNWVVYAKRPFAGPEAVLAYLARYTHRVAIANRRLIAFDECGVTFKYKDYRSGCYRQKVMTLQTDEFIRRFLLHVVPRGFHRIRHYGLLANGTRAAYLAKARALLQCQPPPQPEQHAGDETPTPRFFCRSCATPMIVVAVQGPRLTPSVRAPP